MAPILGFEDAIDIAIFIMMLGGLLKVIGKTGALEAGIKALVQKLKRKRNFINSYINAYFLYMWNYLWYA